VLRGGQPERAARAHHPLAQIEVRLSAEREVPSDAQVDVGIVERKASAKRDGSGESGRCRGAQGPERDAWLLDRHPLTPPSSRVTRNLERDRTLQLPPRTPNAWSARGCDDRDIGVLRSEKAG